MWGFGPESICRRGAPCIREYEGARKDPPRRSGGAGRAEVVSKSSVGAREASARVVNNSSPRPPGRVARAAIGRCQVR